MPDDPSYRSAQQPPTAVRATYATGTRRSPLAAVVPAIILGLVVLTHLPTLSAPLVDRHDFRQTQTAFTARIYHEDGIDLLHPKLPVLGPPWEVPFEFPLFQAAAALVMDIGVPEDTALRATGLASFVLAGALLWLLVRRQAGDIGAGVALVVFATSPLAIEWSRSALIEYLALALAIAFAVAGLRWRERSGAGWFAAALVIGCLATMVKITTAAFWVAPFALLGVWRDDAPATGRTRIGAWSLTIVPLVAGFAWTRWADAIKAASDATAWLTSTALTSWNFGTVAQRLDTDQWEHVVANVIYLGGGIALPLLAIPIVLYAVERRQMRFWAWIAVTLAGPVLVFFNLYFVHDYYPTAVTASIAALVGVGFAALAGMRSVAARFVLVAAGRGFGGRLVPERRVLGADVRSRGRPERRPAARGADQTGDVARHLRGDHRTRLVTVGPVLRRSLGLDDQPPLRPGPDRRPPGRGIRHLSLSVHERVRRLRADPGAVRRPPRRQRSPPSKCVQSRWATNIEAPDGRSTSTGRGTSASLNQARYCSRLTSAVP